MTEPTNTNDASRAACGPLEAHVRPRHELLQMAMNSIGWEVRTMDIDLTGEMPRCTVEVHRDDGRWLYLRVDQYGRASMETWHREIRIGMQANRKPGARMAQSPQITDHFIGRRRFSGPRAMMRNLCYYIADNALRPVQLAGVKNAWRLVMSERTMIGPMPVARSNVANNRCK